MTELETANQRIAALETELAAMRVVGEPGANSRPSLEAVFRGLSDRAYCNYIEQMRRDVCLGWEHKVAQGKFGEPELKGHTLAAQQLGRHKAFSEAANALRGSDAPLTQPAAQDAARLIAAARHIADTATDLGEDFEVGSNAMHGASTGLKKKEASMALTTEQNRDCPHGRQVGKCADCDVSELERQIEHDEALIRKLVEALESAKPVHATSKNTHAVRVGYDIGGYVKHYAIPLDVVQKLVAAGRARLEGKT